MNDWLWCYEGYEPGQEGLREALCTLGNGYFATRGALAETEADGTHYPGTYVAGVYNRLSTEMAGRSVENESLVNVPNWLWLTVEADGVRFTPEFCEPLDHHLELDIRRAILTRRTRYRHPDGRVLGLTQRRFVSLRDPHLACMETTIVAEGWSGGVEITSGLDGRVNNLGVKRYGALDNEHLQPVLSCSASDEVICLEVATTGSLIRVAQSARTRFSRGGEPFEPERRLETGDRHVAHHVTVDVEAGQEVIIEKTVALFTSLDSGIYEPHGESEEAAARAPNFDELFEQHCLSWRHAWNRAGIEIKTSGDSNGDTALSLNLHLLHLLQTVSKNSASLDVGVPARGLHGEAYRGHIFWDELFIFPYLNWRLPELTRGLLLYRCRRLDQARRAAADAGYLGAMFPWQSASSGREETQTLHLNPESGHWLPDASHLQRHINAAIAHNVWAYWQVTRDMVFMRFWGAELMLEIARFWSSIATYNHSLDRYEIKSVMGPDEYHEAYPDADEPGLDNNAYTNLMAVWCILRAFDVLDTLPGIRRDELLEKLDLGGDELDRWGDLTRKMRLCFHGDGIISQFEGFGDLEELDWEDYRARYGNIQRLDRILESEGDTPNRYKLTKQPDTSMLFYLFSTEELTELIEGLGYDFDASLVRRNIDYADQRTSHGSTLSQMVHAWLFSRLDRERSWHLFRTTLMSDILDIQGGTTAEGIHLGAMAGTVDLIQRCYTGLETRGDELVLNPLLPTELESLRFTLRYRGHNIELAFTHDEVTARVADDEHETAGTVRLVVRDQARVLRPGDVWRVAMVGPTGAEGGDGDP